MNSLAHDFRYSVRRLRKNRGFFVFVVFILAIGIGATTAIFSLINTVLLKPLAFRDPDQLVTLWEMNREKGVLPDTTSASNFLDWSERNRSFSGMAVASRIGSITLLGQGPAEEITWSRVSPNFFELLGVNALYGNASSLQPDQIAISYAFWQTHFGKDQQTIGKLIRLDNHAFEIIAVLPASFESPAGNSDIWAPFIIERRLLEPIDRGQNYLRVFGRLKSGTNINHAQQDLNSIAQQLSKEFPKSNRGTEILLISLKDQIVGKVKPVLLVAFAAVALVLLIACSNVASLVLTHFTRRSHEIAIRAALGASRKSIARQLFVESLMIAICGGALGVAVAKAGIVLLLRLDPQIIPRLSDATIDLNTVLFTFGLSILTAVLFGILPAIRASEPAQTDSWKMKQGSLMEGRKTKALRNRLIVFEIALGLFLLIGAGLLIRSFFFLQNVDPGFDDTNLLVARMRLDEEYAEHGRQVQYFSDLMRRLKKVQAITNAGAVTVLPMNPFGIDFDVPYHRAEEAEPERSKAPKAKFRSATPDYFRTMGIALLSGREFSNFDRSDSPRVVVINEALARKISTDTFPIGRKIRFFWSDWQTYEIVGVVANARTYGPLVSSEPELFVPFAQIPYIVLNVVVRTTKNPESMIATVRSVVLEMDPKQPVLSIEPMSSLVRNSTMRERYSMFLVSVLSVIALVLAAAGIYATVYFAVAQRKSEMGIRLALGGTSREIIKTIIKPVLSLAIFGIALGLIGVVLMTHYLSSILFGISPTDAVTLISVSILMIVISLIAAYVPARALMKLDPAEVLRYE